MLHLGSCIYDLTSGSQSWSADLYRLLGVSTEAGPLSPAGLRDLVNSQDFPAVQEASRLSCQRVIPVK
jgi:hypothetical protein